MTSQNYRPASWRKSPTAGWRNEKGRERVSYIVIRVPSCEVRPKHEIVSICLPDGRRFDIFVPSVDVPSDVKIVITESIDSKSIRTLQSASYQRQAGQLHIYDKRDNLHPQSRDTQIHRRP